MSSSSTVSKCFQVLDVIVKSIIEGNGGTKVKDITEVLGFNITSTYRYIASLERQGMIRRTKDEMWILGPKVPEYYHAFSQQSDLSRITNDYMVELWKETEETVFLGCLIEKEVFYLHKIDSPLPIRPHAQVGHRNKLHCTGLGKAILAFCDRDFIQEIADGELVRRTKNTVTDREDLLAELSLTRERGFSIDLMENEEQVHCVAAPIFDSDGKVIAALSISGPAYRMKLDRMLLQLGSKVHSACDKISKELGFCGQLI